ncbi:MAG: DUF3341 domain-containing protein [Bryobacteraceae bacterium]
MAKNIAVFGIYPSRENAENGVDRLVAAGFRHEDVSVLMQDNVGTKDFAHEKHTKAPEGTTTGALAGGIIGGTIGGLIGVGLIAIPGFGPLLAAGPVIGALTGVGSGGFVGGFVGALVGMGIPEYEAKRYEGRIKEGGILLSVHCDDEKWERKAKEVLKGTGAEDIAAAIESPADFARSDKPMSRGAGTIS